MKADVDDVNVFEGSELHHFFYYRLSRQCHDDWLLVFDRFVSQCVNGGNNVPTLRPIVALSTDQSNG